ncbi:hypothetical protein B0T21DRAFT_356557 [Apiosordaria backusii]|uniref:Uncharacterized protein n=1 Tax=Apiosordaria backusii TaxID=314023 RepID=A0AA40K756_9PEZI|nr:hypothetical protein B0T21DRAFT_356557 [Apiosordaria backusii]
MDRLVQWGDQELVNGHGEHSLDVRLGRLQAPTPISGVLCQIKQDLQRFVRVKDLPPESTDDDTMFGIQSGLMKSLIDLHAQTDKLRDSSFIYTSTADRLIHRDVTAMHFYRPIYLYLSRNYHITSVLVMERWAAALSLGISNFLCGTNSHPLHRSCAAGYALRERLRSLGQATIFRDQETLFTTVYDLRADELGCWFCPFRCHLETSNLLFENQVEWRSHLRQWHLRGDIWSCSEHHQSFESKESMIEHRISQHNASGDENFDRFRFITRQDLWRFCPLGCTKDHLMTEEEEFTSINEQRMDHCIEHMITKHFRGVTNDVFFYFHNKYMDAPLRCAGPVRKVWWRSYFHDRDEPKDERWMRAWQDNRQCVQESAGHQCENCLWP